MAVRGIGSVKINKILTDKKERKKNMKIPIYKSYGVLAHEYQPVYTWACPKSDVYDEIIVEVPNVDGENCDGDPLVNLGDGLVYPLRMVLGNWGDEPALVWYDGVVQRHKILKAYTKL